MDQFDQAQESDARETEAAYRAQQARAANAVKLTATGECQNPMCGEELEPPRLFCGPKCAQQHARRTK